MYPVSARFLEAISGSHRVAVRAQVLCDTAGRPLPPQFGPNPTGGQLLPLLDGDVKLTSRASVQGTVDLQVPGDYWDLLQPYGVEVFVERGIDFGDGTGEYVPLGYYEIEEIERRVGGPVTVSGSDRMARLRRGRVVYPVQFAAGATHRQVFEQLVNGDAGQGQSTESYGMFLFTRVPITWTSYNPDEARLGTSLVCEDDKLDFLAKLIDPRGCIMRFDRLGGLRVEPRDIAPGAEPIYAIRPGPGGNLIEASQKVTREGVYNLVVARGSDPAAPTGYRLAYNDDPSSPLRWTGPYGVVPRYYASPLLQTSEATDVAAEKVLARYRGLPSALSLLAVPNPALDPLDVAQATVGATAATHLLDEVTIPLVGSSPVQIVTRTLNEIPADDEAGGGGVSPIPNPGTGGGTGGGTTDPGTGGGTGGGTTTPGAPIYAEQFADGTPWPVVTGGTTATSGSGASAVSGVANGARLALSGTISSAVTITGRSNVTIDGNRQVDWTSGTLTIRDCANVIVRGINFTHQNAGDAVSVRGSSHHIQFVDCTWGPTSHSGSATTGEAGNFVYVGDDCHNVRIDFCELRNKSRAGNGIRVYGNFTTYRMCRYVLIAHCYIHDFYPAAVNDFEPIRAGVSSMSRSDGFVDVFRNVFRNIRSEPEIISIKSNRCRAVGNTVLQSAGSIVIRHGRNCAVLDNYTIDGANTTNTNGEGSGGERFYDSDHEVAWNTNQQLSGTAGFQGAMQVHGGDAEGSSTNLSAHWRVVRARVHNNAIVECATGITVGGNYSMPPQDCAVVDNLVAASGSQAVTYLNGITPGSIGTVTGNVWDATATGAGMTRDADGIWRRPGYGSRLTYLTPSDVGPAAPTAARGDGAGRSRTTATTGGGTPVDTTTAAGRLNWGAPIASDELNYTGPPDPARWSVYDGPGHDGNGVRSPDRVTVDGNKMVLTGLAGATPNTAGLAHRTNQRFGRWEVRCRSEQTGTSGANTYNVLLILWPQNNTPSWPRGGEYDFLELGDPGQSGAQAFLHYPSLDGDDSAIQLSLAGVDTSQWHNYAIDWNANGISLYVDGVLWATRSGGGNSTRRDLQDAPSPMHLTVQLDATQPSDYRSARMEVDWVRVYPATPIVDPGTGGGTGTFTSPGQVLRIRNQSGGNWMNWGIGYSPGDDPLNQTSSAVHRDASIQSIASGLIVPGYFEMSSDGQRARISAHLDGGRTSANTQYPRSEGRELNPDGSKAAWSISSSTRHYMRGITRVLRMPPNKPQLSIGQIHGGSDDFSMLRLDSRTTVNARFGDTGIIGTLTSSLQFGVDYEWMIEVDGLRLNYYWIDMDEPAVSRSVSPASGMYFKSGAYAQSNSSIDAVEDGPFIIEMSDLEIWHTGRPDPVR